MAVESFSGLIQRHNMMIGILVCALLTSILFIIMLPFGFLYVEYILLIVGNFFGLYLTFKYRKELQSPIKTGIIVGLTGSVLALFLMSLFYWILISVAYGFDFILFLIYILIFFGYYGIIYVLIGIIVGYLFGNYYRKKEDIDRESPIF
ncbi:MAG: hypothetical protein ACFFKA_21800 [Candidatus Thorarchaeota archaeon]